ncbi:MAG: polysaccharide deacetylase family protein [Microcystis sp. M53601_WE4]|nr:polysaccharide deacetylase family protein [Microcystis sp. M53601_WE4]
MSIAKLIISIVARLLTGAIFYQPTGEKIIALTIDDLPTPNDPEGKSTDRILAAIAAHNREKASPVKATFFLITGHLQPNSTLIERLIAQGHEIANHGSQDLRTSQLAADAFASQFREAHDILSRLAGQAPRWYRPGQAFYNQSMRSFLGKFPGYESRFALASMIPLDTRKATNHPQFTTWYISQFIFPGAILVLHGGSPERDENTAIVLKNLLAKLHDRGYQVVTLSQLVAHKRY